MRVSQDEGPDADKRAARAVRAHPIQMDISSRALGLGLMNSNGGHMLVWEGN